MNSIKVTVSYYEGTFSPTQTHFTEIFIIKCLFYKMKYNSGGKLLGKYQL